MVRIILCLLMSVLVSCGGGRGVENNGTDYPVINSKAYNNGNVALFGDSIAKGEGATSTINSLTGCMLNTVGGKVSNLAVSGATSVSAMPQLKIAVEETFSIVVVSLGGNDAIVDSFEGGLPTETTLRNMRNIFRRLIERGSLVVYLGLNPPKDPMFPVDSSRLLQVSQIAREEGVLLVDESMKGLWGDSKLMSDLVHPNDQGYAVICDRLKTALSPHLK